MEKSDLRLFENQSCLCHTVPLGLGSGLWHLLALTFPNAVFGLSRMFAISLQIAQWLVGMIELGRLHILQKGRLILKSLQIRYYFLIVGLSILS